MRRATVALLGATALLAGCGGGGESGDDDSAAPSTSAAASTSAGLSDEDRAQAAYDYCVEAVTDRLKAPATAQFAPLEDVDLQKDSGNYTIVGDVDSENGFGALIRTSYSCEVFVASNGHVAGSAKVTVLSS